MLKRGPTKIKFHTSGAQDETALEADIGVLSVTLYKGPVAQQPAGGIGAGELDARRWWPQPQIPCFALWALHLVRWKI